MAELTNWEGLTPGVRRLGLTPGVIVALAYRKTQQELIRADYLLIDLTTLKLLSKLNSILSNMARKNGPGITYHPGSKPAGAAPALNSSLETPSGFFSTTSTTSTCPHCNTVFQDLPIAVWLPSDIVGIIISTVTD